MAVKKNSYVDFELEWLQEKADQLKTYVDNNPFHELVDRLAWKSLVVATIEAQIKSLTQALKDYAQIIEVIDKLREKEEQKAEARGSQEINGKMKPFS